MARQYLIRSRIDRVVDPRSIYSSIQPGLGSPAPYCDCSNQRDFTSNNFVTLLISAQYLLYMCKQFCHGKNDQSEELDTLQDESSNALVITSRSGESFENANPQAEMNLSKVLASLSMTTTTTTTSTTTTTTTTTTTATTTLLYSSSPRTSTESFSFFQKYFSSLEKVAPSLKEYFQLTKQRRKTKISENLIEEEEDKNVIKNGKIHKPLRKKTRKTEDLQHDQDEGAYKRDEGEVEHSEPGGFRSMKSKAPSIFGKRWRALSCPSYCSKTVDPVCGSDGIIYKNDCDMRKRTCNQDVKAVDFKECSLHNGSKCQHKCDKTKDMVCGTDGRTYLNKCFLQVEFCERGIEFSHFGSCLNGSAVDEKCPASCTRQFSKGGPICGSDENVYPSECEMKLRTCGQGVVSIDRAHCQTTEHCDSGCWRVSRLTCGSDGKLYNNGCQMKRRNCGRHIFEAPVPFCLNKLYRTDCPLSCEGTETDEVCGSDGNIYRNKCEMKKLTCGFPLTRYERITEVDFSLCQSKAQSCSQMVCPEGGEEVCGNDGKTYSNSCLLRKATCTGGVELSHMGKCTDLSKKDECPKNCSEDENAEIVCGSNGNVYESECEMKRRTCGQRVAKAPFSHCKSTKYCEAECSKTDKKLVCGSDAQFYESECEMRKQNCGRHMYIAPISMCLRNFRFVFSGCGRVCPSEYDPVCGTDGKTYSNQCFMEMENCRARSLGGVTRKYFGKCGEPKQKPRYYLYKRR